jgi:S1-C subfamily serine protease
MSSYRRYPPPRSQTSAVPFWVLLLLLAAVGFLIWHFWPSHAQLTNPNAKPRAVTPRGPLAEDEKSTIALFRNASPSVVHILTTMAPQRNFFSNNEELVPQGTGSGIIWDDKGRIVTNYHVIQGATTAEVTLADHSSWNAKLVGKDVERDLAVLWIDAPQERLHPLALGSSHDLQVGQKVFAIGNPFGLDHTLTTGVVSALGREIQAEDGRSLRGAIQTDAPINPGNSGGPLLDSAGRLIGLNSAILSPSKASAGIGFAIPVDDVNRVVTQLIRYGQAIRPGLGIQEAPDQVAQKLGLKGVLILNVNRDGPAAKAGLRGTRRDRFGQLRLGDVIVAVDGKAVTSTGQLFDLLEQHKVGETVTVTVERSGQRLNKQVQLEKEAA